MSTLLDLQRADTDDDSDFDPGASGRHDIVAVRAWARSRGYPIDETSGVPLPVLRAFRRLHSA